jgi:predicted membrane protein
MTEKSDKKKKIKKTWKISTTVARNYMKFCERMKKRLDAIYNSKAYSFLFRRRMSIKLKISLLLYTTIFLIIALFCTVGISSVLDIASEEIKKMFQTSENFFSSELKDTDLTFLKANTDVDNQEFSDLWDIFD